MSVNLVLVCSSSYEFRSMKNDTDSQSFITSPMLLSLKDRKATLATIVHNYASNSLKHSGPRFNEDVVAMMYLAIDCIANSCSIIALPSKVRDGTAIHVAHCLVHTYNLTHGDGVILGDGPTFGAKAASTREVTVTEVARAGQGATARGAFAEGFELEAKIVGGGAARTNNGSVEQQSWEQKTFSLSNATVGKSERGPQATTGRRRSSTHQQWIRGAAARGAAETFNTVGKDKRDLQATTGGAMRAAARVAERGKEQCEQQAVQQNKSEEQSKQQHVKYDENDEQSEQQSAQRPTRQSLSDENSLDESSPLSDGGWPPQNPWKGEIREIHEEFPESVICEYVLSSMHGCQLTEEFGRQER